MPSDERPVASVPVVDALAQISFAVFDVLSRTSAEFDLSVTQLRLLGILRDRTPSMAAIADFLRLDRSSVSGLIDRAERRGLLARHTSPGDARVTIVELTPSGRTVADDLQRAVGHRIAELLEGVSAADRARFVKLASTIRSR